jgi:excisionase family DNA binding protein
VEKWHGDCQCRHLPPEWNPVLSAEQPANSVSVHPFPDRVLPLLAGFLLATFVPIKDNSRTMVMLDPKYMTIHDAVRLLGCTQSYVRRLLRDGVIAGEKLSGRVWLVESRSAREFARRSVDRGRPRVGPKIDLAKKR